MPHTSIEKLPVLPLIFASNVAGDPEPPDEESDPPPNGAGETKPPASDAPDSNAPAPADDDIIIKGG